MFDFAVDSRYEGGQAALNDKGLITADRSIKKDSFYLYKANWNQNDPFAYITATGCNQAGYATLYEIEVDGYSLTSDANIPGDVNRDGIVDVLDVMTLAQIVVGKTTPAEGVSQEVMDLNGDHSVNVLDVMCLAQIAAGRLS